MFSSSFRIFFAGAIVGLSFAPLHIFPAIIGLSVLLSKITHSTSIKQAFKYGYIFGFGLFLALLYWIAIGVSVYAEKFWWAIPFALFGLPLIMAFFPAFVSACSFQFRDSKYAHIVFCIIWVFFEWLSSWIFTGLPWGLLGYSFSFSLTLLQSASIFGVYGLSFLAAYLGSMFFVQKNLTVRIGAILPIVIAALIFGYVRLDNNPTEYSDLTARIVQPSIKQEDKWSDNQAFQNINKHIELSTRPFEAAKDGLTKNTADLIIWSEAALTIPYYFPPLYEQLLIMLEDENQVLITGGITDNGLRGRNLEIYSSIIALTHSGELDFEYHKSHLVPFGEYIPFSKYLPLQKITPGIMDYTEGNYEIVTLDKYNIRIKPQICYEAIFPDDAAVSANEADLIINVTNDSWYGNSSGPFQHFQIARMRAIENALPLIRAANNGISAIIDPVGRIIDHTELNAVTTIDSFIPLKLNDNSSLYYRYGYLMLLTFITLVLMLQISLHKMLKN